MTSLEKFGKIFGDKYKLFELIVNNSPDIIFINDLEGNFLYSNKLTIFGYSHTDLANRDMFSLVHPDDQKNVTDKLHNMRTDAISQNIEYRFLHKQGHYVSLSSGAVLIQDNMGKDIGVLTNTHELKS